jgi:hypothetical protein
VNYKGLLIVVLVVMASMAVPAVLTVMACIHCGLRLGGLAGLLMIGALLLVRHSVR